MTGERGVSSVISTVLMVGIVVLIAIPAGIYAFQVAEPGSDPAPQLKRSNATMTAAGSVDLQTVNVTHGGGETIDVKNVEVVVRVKEDGNSARIVDLPSSTNTLSSSNVEGDSIISKSYKIGGTPLTTAGENGEWSSGETVSFQVDSTALDPGDTVVVTFVHTETNSVLGKETFTAAA